MITTELVNGKRVIVNGDYRFAVLIPSRKREEMLLRHPLLPVANVYVQDDEYEIYARTLSDNHATVGALFAHDAPPGFYFEWAHERLYDPEHENWYVQVEDDVIGLVNLFTRIASRSHVTDPLKLLDIFTHDGIIASELPTGAWGYALTGNPRERRTYLPFRLRGWADAAVMGIIDKSVVPDPNVFTRGDVDYCLQMIVRYRVFWQDMRYAPVMKHEGGRSVGVGGLGGMRTTEQNKADLRYLIKKWGRNVISPYGKEHGPGIAIQVTVPQHHRPPKENRR